jgi:hypothetical protein
MIRKRKLSQVILAVIVLLGIVYASGAVSSLDCVRAEGNGDIALDTESVRNRSESKSSFADLYGVPAFSNQFLELEEKVKAEEVEEKEAVFNAVINASGKEKENYDEILEAVLLSDNEVVVSDMSMEAKSKDKSQIIMYIYGMIGFGVIITFFVWIDRRKKREARNEK